MESLFEATTVRKRGFGSLANLQRLRKTIMIQTLVARTFPTAFVFAALCTAFGASAQEAPARVDAAQNGGAAAAAVDAGPKYNAGLNGRVKPAQAKVREQVAQNGGETAGAAYDQPKYNAALSGRAGAAPTTVSQSDKEGKTAE